MQPSFVSRGNSAATLKSADTTGDWQMEPGSDNDLSLKQLDLLNQAIKIDSNYFVAYNNKFGVERRLKKYKDALITANEMLRLFPRDPTLKFFAGKMYDINGDTIRARAYYQDYLFQCNRELDTMTMRNKQREFLELQKGLVLVLLGQPKKGQETIKGLYEKADSWDKAKYLLCMRLKRADMLNPKDTSITIGNCTTIINTFSP